MLLKEVEKNYTKVSSRVGSIKRFEAKEDLTILLVFIKKIAGNS